ncbi:MAG: hypothetical protein JEZ06_10930 [Anaerolineaceae bacterium]|nr:hypothetical protein [Anaerolineaceae bacterium]
MAQKKPIGKKKKIAPQRPPQTGPSRSEIHAQQQEDTMKEVLIRMAEENPEALAEIIQKWLEEGKEPK